MQHAASIPKTRADGAVDELLPGLRKLPWASRTQARARYKALCLDEMEALLPEGGLLLDVGCGQGIASHWMARCRSEARIVAIDFDGRKLEHARRFAPVSKNLEFIEGDAIGFIERLPVRSVRLALLADFLSSLAPDRQRRILRALARCLEPDGHIVLLFVDTKPRWRFLLNLARSTVICKVLRLSRIEGGSFGYVGLAAYRQWLEAEGFAVTVDRPLPGLAPRRRLVAKRVSD